MGGVNLLDIRKEIEAGLPNHRPRLNVARMNLHYYQGDFQQYYSRPVGYSYDAERYIRHSKLMYRAVKILTSYLYRHGPARRLPDHPEAQEWLEDVYRGNQIDAMWQEADALSIVSEVACFQATLSEDPRKPVRLQLWDASSFIPWVNSDDPTEALVVAILDEYNEQRRLRLYTPEICETYLTKELKPWDTAGGSTYRLSGREPNPFGRLPFAFVHFEMPIADFWCGSPGDNLREANDYLIKFFTDHGDAIRYNSRPTLIGYNVLVGWRPPSPWQPGLYWDIPGNVDAAGQGLQPRIEYLQSDPGWIQAGWEEANNYTDHVLQMHGIPPAAWRMDQSVTRSGVAMLAEQIPVQVWAESRQRLFAKFEDELAKLVLYAGSIHYGYNGMAAASQLAAAAEDPGLVLHWPPAQAELPGTDRDQSDQWELDNGVTSRIEIIMKRRKVTREEAEEILEQIAKDRELEVKLLQGTYQEEQEPALVGAPSRNGDGEDPDEHAAEDVEGPGAEDRD